MKKLGILLLVPSLYVLPVNAQQVEAKDILLAVRAQCATEWGTDYTMVRHCIKREYEALRIAAKYYQAGGESTNITRRCFNEWIIGGAAMGWRMTVHCIKRQAEAYNSLIGQR